MPRPLVVTFLAGTLVLGCGEQSSPAEPANAPQPLLRSEQQTASVGAEVIRFPFEFIPAGPDPATGLAPAGSGAAALCQRGPGGAREARPDGMSARSGGLLAY